jgi:outer membrane beta-barrel protein
MNWIKLFLSIFFAIALADRVHAEVINLPTEELAKESVLPVFDKPVSLKNRNVQTAERIDLGVNFGLALSEPIYNTNKLGLSLFYHTSEDHAFGLHFAKNGGGVSSYANQLKDQYSLDFSRAPAPLQTIIGEWDWKFFYGKMSLTKDSIMNTSVFTTLGAGMIQYQHKSYPAIAPGLGQKFYFGKSFALRFDLKLFMHQAPIPFLKGGLRTSGSPADPIPAYESFQERLTFTSVLDVGLSWLF